MAAASVRAAMRQAYKATDPDRARKRLVAMAGRLRAEEPSAASSIEEGLESLTVKRLKLPSSLERILSTTNARRVAGASGLKALVAALRNPAVAVSTKAA